ncbi:hypothetical protein [Fujian dimarhabdovirus]|uniref:Uncharacterized protein n=1 Tax=Fujian dimarhabdovirus TaxID=2116366 RepID=A0A2P1GMR6_9RHAB|nr:hypothetical protein [Fujian dimarhabdovirus]
MKSNFRHLLLPKENLKCAENFARRSLSEINLMKRTNELTDRGRSTKKIKIARTSKEMSEHEESEEEVSQDITFSGVAFGGITEGYPTIESSRTEPRKIQKKRKDTERQSLTESTYKTPRRLTLQPSSSRLSEQSVKARAILDTLDDDHRSIIQGYLIEKVQKATNEVKTKYLKEIKQLETSMEWLREKAFSTSQNEQCLPEISDNAPRNLEREKPSTSTSLPMSVDIIDGAQELWTNEAEMSPEEIENTLCSIFINGKLTTLKIKNIPFYIPEAITFLQKRAHFNLIMSPSSLNSGDAAKMFVSAIGTIKSIPMKRFGFNPGEIEECIKRYKK